jgi:hypothetical protein
MGVQYVLVPRPAQDRLTRALDATPELTRLSRTDSFGLWRMPSPAGRLMLLDGATVTPLNTGPDGTSTRVRIPPGSAGRTLLLAEPADGGWRAGLDGREVKSRTVDGWAQAYEIPASGGLFELSRSMWLRHSWVSVQGVALLLVVVLALPGARQEASPPVVSRRTGRHGRHTRRHRAQAAAGSLARRAAIGAGRRTDALRARIHHDVPAEVPEEPVAEVPVEEPKLAADVADAAEAADKPHEGEVPVPSEERS